MNKRQIKAELIRSACEDARPFIGMAWQAFDVFCNWCKEMGESGLDELYMDNHYRILMLLCAESL